MSKQLCDPGGLLSEVAAPAPASLKPPSPPDSTEDVALL